MRAEISQAIATRHVLELRYHGYSRTVEPHAYGRDKSGDDVLRCYQITGGSESGERIGWKLLKVADAFAIQLLRQPFVQRSGYKRNDKVIEYIFSQL